MKVRQDKVRMSMQKKQKVMEELKRKELDRDASTKTFSLFSTQQGESNVSPKQNARILPSLRGALKSIEER